MSADRFLVSVIVPVRNGARYLGEALESVFAQGYSPLEVLVVDDGSTDETAEVARSREGVRYLHQAHQGVAAARNTGIDASCGEILVFLDCDDIWPPKRLDTMVEYFERHPDVGYVLGKEMMFVEPGCAVPPWVKDEWLEQPQDASNTAVLGVRREALERVGHFNSEYRSSEDTEWLVRASEAGIAMARLQEVVLHKRIHEGNLSTQTYEARGETLLRIARESMRRRQEST